MFEDNKVIFPKSIVKAWLEKAMEKEYQITVYPKDKILGDRFLNFIKSKKLDYKIFEDKVVIIAKDPIKVANIIVQIERMGYFVETL